MLSSWSMNGIVAVSAVLLIASLLFEERFDAKSFQTPTRETAATEKTCLDPEGPHPFILMSLGRSGSGSTFQILTNLTGMETPSEEYTGSSPYKSTQFFRKIKNDAGAWVVDYLCEKQRLYPQAGLVGFKWKPWKSAIYSPAALDGLNLIAQSHDPTIKIVRLRRNLLDVYLSIQKHRQMAHVKGHCQKGDEACARLHQKAGTNMTISVNDALHYLETMTKQEEEVDALLDNMKIPHVHVSYEALYHDDSAEEWIKAFAFLGIGPGEELTRQELNEAMGIVSTSNGRHRDSVQNFDELKKALDGTKYESLLHRRL